jgi:hypothetical protein
MTEENPMHKPLLSAAIAALALAGTACAAQADKGPPGGDYQKVSDLVAGSPGGVSVGRVDHERERCAGACSTLAGWAHPSPP